MKRPLFALTLAALAALIFVVPGMGPAQRVEAADGFNIASETYYRLDVPNGTASVSMDAQVQNTSRGPLTSIYLWAMPVLTDLAVTQDGKPLVTEVIFSQDNLYGAPLSLIEVTLEKPLKPNAKLSDIKMTYVAPPQESENVTFAAGVMEALFVGQGPGSFVLIDSPRTAMNYHDPGCLLASSRPKDVVEAGMERWVCGEATIIALNAEESGVLKQCAGMDDKCRQRLLESPYSAFAQSVTDSSLLATLEEHIPLSNGNVNLSLLYFRKDAAWAQKQFDVAKVALPKLEAVFGFPYRLDTLVMRQSHHIELIGAAGIAFGSIGEVLLATGTGSDEHVTVHELAHQWAYQSTTDKKSIWEGLAEYATFTLQAEMGFVPGTRDWQSYEYKDEAPLIGWDEQWGGSGEFWYGKAGAFYKEYESAIGGPANMTTVLSGMYTDPPTPKDHRWFMDRGEEVSGANLDELFLEWVFYEETAAPLIAERRAARTGISELATRAATAGLAGTPKDIALNMANWQFGGVSKQIADADAVIVAYTEVLGMAAESGLPMGNAVKDAWTTRSMREVAAIVEDTRQTILAIDTAASQLSDDAVGAATLEDAREAFSAGKLTEAKDLAAKSRTMRFNIETAEALVDIAVEKQASFTPNLFTRIGLYGKDPDADLTAAQEAMAAGKPEEAMVHAKAAFKVWDSAEKNGMARLAIAFALMAGISTGTWWLLKKLDVRKPDEGELRRRATGGHVLQPADERKPGWKDWGSGGGL